MRKLIYITILAALSISCRAQAPETDVCVYGGTASGFTAAVQAARMGKKTILVCERDHVGGMVTSGLTATDMNRNDVVGGIAWEYYARIYDHYASPEAWRCQTRDEFMEKTLKRTYTGRNEERRMQWVYESHVAERIMKEMLAEAGVEVIYGAPLDRSVKVEKRRGNLSAITLEGGRVLTARMYIDCSYEGDLMAAAGVSFTVGREANAAYGETLNGIRVNRTDGKNLSAIDPYVKEGDPASGPLPYVDAKPWGADGEADGRTQAYCYRMTLTDDPANMIPIEKPADYDPLRYEILVRMLTLEPETPLQKIITLTPMPNRKTDTNHLDFFGASYDYPEASYADRAKIEQLHKDYALGMLWLLANDPRIPQAVRDEMKPWGLPKDEFADTGNFPWQIYVREARRMVGQLVMTEQNVRKTERTPATDCVGMGSYALDCHYVSRVVDTEGKLRNEGTIFQPTTPYPIGYGAIVPREEECRNLLVPVCLSATHVAMSSIRMEPVYMVLGQSAATAAAMAIDARVPVQKVSYTNLRERLLQDGQILETPKKQAK